MNPRIVWFPVKKTESKILQTLEQISQIGQGILGSENPFIQDRNFDKKSNLKEITVITQIKIERKTSFLEIEFYRKII